MFTAQRILYVHRCLQQKPMGNMFTRGKKGAFYVYCCLYVKMSRNVLHPQNQTYKDLFNQKGLKVFHQNIRGFFHNTARLSTFLHTQKTHFYFLSVKRTSIIQHQHNFLKFRGTPSLIKIEMLALTVALLFI